MEEAYLCQIKLEKYRGRFSLGATFRAMHQGGFDGYQFSCNNENISICGNEPGRG